MPKSGNKKLENQIEKDNINLFDFREAIIE